MSVKPVEFLENLAREAEAVAEEWPVEDRYSEDLPWGDRAVEGSTKQTAPSGPTGRPPTKLVADSASFEDFNPVLGDPPHMDGWVTLQHCNGSEFHDLL